MALQAKNRVSSRLYLPPAGLKSQGRAQAVRYRGSSPHESSRALSLRSASSSPERAPPRASAPPR
eukprot:342077-Rhodomonas_salina.3